MLAVLADQIERVVALAGGMLGRDVEAREVVVVALDVRAFGHREAHLAEQRDEFINSLADRMDAALGDVAHGQRHVDRLEGEARVGLLGLECRLARVEPGGEHVLPAR